MFRKQGSLSYHNDEFLLFIQKKVNKDPTFMDNKGGPLPLPFHLRFAANFPNMSMQQNNLDCQPIHPINIGDMQNKGLLNLGIPEKNIDPFKPFLGNNTMLGPNF